MVLLKSNDELFRIGSVLIENRKVVVYTDTHLPSRIYHTGSKQQQVLILNYLVTLMKKLNGERNINSEPILNITDFEGKLKSQGIEIEAKKSSRMRKKDENLFVITENGELLSLDHFYMYFEKNGFLNCTHDKRRIAYKTNVPQESMSKYLGDTFNKVVVRNKKLHGDIVIRDLKELEIHIRDIIGVNVVFNTLRKN